MEGTNTMTTVNARARAVAAAAALLAGATACGAGTQASTSNSSASRAWTEPASYVYTLNSAGGERALIGTFRITVRGHQVVHARGLDDSARRVVADLPDQVPTIGRLLGELEQARDEGADEAVAEYASDGHPERIALDWDENAIDDEALYTISAYKATAGHGS
jgi:hypothetical protein